LDKDYLTSLISQSFHYVAFSCKKPPSNFDSASIIMSIDVDAGSPELGIKNKGVNDRNVNDFLTESTVGKIEARVVPLLLEAFNKFEFPVTFALRGQLTEVENSIIDLILESSIKHEIAAHGYSHKVFTALSTLEADQELKMISAGMKRFGITPRSFVFPKNRVSHLELLGKHGYLSFRDRGNFLRDGMFVRKCGNIFDVHPGLFLSFNNYFFYERIVNLAVKFRAPLHLWFHPWNLGSSSETVVERITKILFPLLKHVGNKRKQGVLKFETMFSIAEEYQRFGKIHNGRG
jgi:peptidoglycan/xylan/chitin deacetylase (PgdA/CDA1 family)